MNKKQLDIFDIACNILFLTFTISIGFIFLAAATWAWYELFKHMGF